MSAGPWMVSDTYLTMIVGRAAATALFWCRSGAFPQTAYLYEQTLPAESSTRPLQTRQRPCIQELVQLRQRPDAIARCTVYADQAAMRAMHGSYSTRAGARSWSSY